MQAVSATIPSQTRLQNKISRQENIIKVSGHITDEQGIPVIMAVIIVKDENIHTLTDEDGYYSLNIKHGEHEIEISSLGYRKIEKKISITAYNTKIDFKMKTESLAVDGAIVTAVQSRSRNGSSSFRMEENAIKQIQTVSISDILSLLPGEKITPPDLSDANQANFRSAVSTQMNAFGTSLLLDGTPVNNDANMQSLNPSVSSGGTRGSVVNGGVDLRSLPTSNIESVEVITGVASAKYGNLTSGTVMVTRKAGQTPFSISLNLTPTSYQAGLSKGFALGSKGGFLNTDLDYTYSLNSTTDNSLYFQRIGISTRWTVPVLKRIEWVNTLSANYSFTGDQEREDKDRILPYHSDTQNHFLSIGANGHMNVLGHLTYNFNINLTSQHSYKEHQVAGPLPMVEPTETGTYFTTYSPLSFQQCTSIDGLPINLFGRIDASQNVHAGKVDFNFLTGVEMNWSKNYGKGRANIGDAVSNGGVPGSRGVEFHDIPASSAFALYEEVDIRHKRKKSEYLLRIGGRYDFMNLRYHLLSPRISASAKFFDRLNMRVAYGISYKAPSMMQLYPGPTYFDINNFNHYTTDPNERMAIVTTYKYMPVNDHLKPSTGTTLEAGIDWEGEGYYIRLTGYMKDIRGGISYNQSMIALKNDQYRIVAQEEGKQPVVEKTDEEMYVPRILNTYTNNLFQQNRGIELTVAPPQIKATHTSFHLSGSFVRTKIDDNNPDIRISQYINSGAAKYGVYHSVSKIYDKCTANFNIIQQIPSLKMMITVIFEMNIYNNQKTIGADIYPYAWYDKNGVLHDMTEAQKTSPEFADLVLDERMYIYEKPPFYPNIHLQLRKEIKNGHSFSFYANNCLWINPEYITEIRKTRTRLNSRISFGCSANFKF